MSFTPGPWRAYPVQSRRKPGIRWYGIAAQDGDNPRLIGTADHEANAHLMAAAPELMHALSWLLNAWESDRDEIGWDAVEDAASAARTAIAKAKGE